MLKYCIQILNKVSFDKNLLKKELCKALSWLNKDERKILKKWTIKKFGEKGKRQILLCEIK